MKGWVRKRIRWRARLHDQAVGRAQLLDAEQGDDVLQLAIMGDRLADVLRDPIMRRRRRAAGRAGSTSRRADRSPGTCPRWPCWRDSTIEEVEMAEDLGDRRVGEIVGRDVDRLDRGDRGAGDRGDALLELGDLARQRRLVADPRRQPAEQPGHLAAGLDEAVHVVDQQQHVLVRRVAEMLGDGERRQAGPPARAGRLVHLAEDQSGPFEHAGLPAVRATARGPRASARRCRRRPRCRNGARPWCGSVP